MATKTLEQQKAKERAEREADEKFKAAQEEQRRAEARIAALEKEK